MSILKYIFPILLYVALGFSHRISCAYSINDSIYAEKQDTIIEFSALDKYIAHDLLRIEHQLKTNDSLSRAGSNEGIYVFESSLRLTANTKKSASGEETPYLILDKVNKDYYQITPQNEPQINKLLSDLDNDPAFAEEKSAGKSRKIIIYITSIFSYPQAEGVVVTNSSSPSPKSEDFIKKCEEYITNKVYPAAFSGKSFSTIAIIKTFSIQFQKSNNGSIKDLESATNGLNEKLYSKHTFRLIPASHITDPCKVALKKIFMQQNSSAMLNFTQQVVGQYRMPDCKPGGIRIDDPLPSTVCFVKVTEGARNETLYTSGLNRFVKDELESEFVRSRGAPHGFWSLFNDAALRFTDDQLRSSACFTQTDKENIFRFVKGLSAKAKTSIPVGVQQFLIRVLTSIKGISSKQHFLDFLKTEPGMLNLLCDQEYIADTESGLTSAFLLDFIQVLEKDFIKFLNPGLPNSYESNKTAGRVFYFNPQLYTSSEWDYAVGDIKDDGKIYLGSRLPFLFWVQNTTAFDPFTPFSLVVINENQQVGTQTLKQGDALTGSTLLIYTYLRFSFDEKLGSQNLTIINTAALLSGIGGYSSSSGALRVLAGIDVAVSAAALIMDAGLKKKLLDQGHTEIVSYWDYISTYGVPATYATYGLYRLAAKAKIRFPFAKNQSDLTPDELYQMNRMERTSEEIIQNFGQRYPNLKAQLDNLDEAAKTKFAEDFAEASDEVLMKFEGDPKLLDAWKVLISENAAIVLRKNIDFLHIIVDYNDEIAKRAYPNLLKLEEEAVLRFYTTKKGYENFNKALRGEIPMSEMYLVQERIMNEALDKLPKSNVTFTFRGTGPDESAIFEALEKGQNYKYENFVSSSIETDIADDFMYRKGGSVILVIKPLNGKSIGLIAEAYESEVLFKSKTKFEVTYKGYRTRFMESDPVIREIHLKEIE